MIKIKMERDRIKLVASKTGHPDTKLTLSRYTHARTLQGLPHLFILPT